VISLFLVRFQQTDLKASINQPINQRFFADLREFRDGNAGKGIATLIGNDVIPEMQVQFLAYEIKILEIEINWRFVAACLSRKEKCTTASVRF
jgi:hypothetical protein